MGCSKVGSLSIFRSAKGFGQITSYDVCRRRRLPPQPMVDDHNAQVANRCRDLPPNGEAQISFIPFPFPVPPRGGGSVRKSGSRLSSPVCGRGAPHGPMFWPCLFGCGTVWLSAIRASSIRAGIRRAKIFLPQRDHFCQVDVH